MLLMQTSSACSLINKHVKHDPARCPLVLFGVQIQGNKGFHQNTAFNLILGIQAAILWCSNQNFPSIMLEDNFTDKFSATATWTPQQRHWKVSLESYWESQNQKVFSWFNKWNLVRNKKSLKKEASSFYQTTEYNKWEREICPLLCFTWSEHHSCSTTPALAWSTKRLF